MAELSAAARAGLALAENFHGVAWPVSWLTAEDKLRGAERSIGNFRRRPITGEDDK